MSVNVIKWSYVYGNSHAELFSSVEEAVAAAKALSDAGDESLHCLEVFEDDTSRIIAKDEVWRLAEPLYEADEAEWKNQPKPTASVFILAPDGKEARWGNFVTMEQAVAAAGVIGNIISPDRVRVSRFPR